MSLECEHGQLARACNICEYEREIAELKARVGEQDEVYDALSVSFDDLKQKYHDLADVSYFKNALLAAANQRARELKEERDGYQDGQLREEVDRLKAELASVKKCWEYKAVQELEAELAEARKALESIEQRANERHRQ